MMLYSEQMNSQMSVVDRARLYVSKIDPAISGQNGHDKFFSVACKLVIGFALNREQALEVISEYNERCEPPFSEYEVAHKIDDAFLQEGNRGELAGDVPPWEKRNGNHYEEPVRKQESKLTESNGILGELIGKLYRGEGDILYDAGDPFGGFECGPGKITILGAPPGAGKTALVMQYVFSLLENDPKAEVVIANAEMTFEVLLRRELTRRSEVSGGKLRFANVTPNELRRVEEAAEAIQPLLSRVKIMEPPYTTDALCGLLEGGRKRLLVIDYLQKFAGGEDPRVGVNNVMGILRTLAMDDWGILALSSVTRVKKNEELSMSSFKESGEIEFNADACYLLKDQGSHEGDERIREVILNAVKNRHGEMRDIDLVFDKPQMTFSELVKQWDFGEADY